MPTFSQNAPKLINLRELLQWLTTTTKLNRSILARQSHPRQNVEELAQRGRNNQLKENYRSSCVLGANFGINKFLKKSNHHDVE